MCIGPELALLAAGTGLNIAGGRQQQREADANMLREVRGRNEMLARHNRLQDEYAAANRARMGGFLDEVGPETKLAEAQADRIGALQAAVTEDEPGPEMPTAADAPRVVNVEFAKRMRDALDANRKRADKAGKFAGFGEQLFRNSVGREDLGRGLMANENFSRQEASLLPHYQDMRALEVFRPSSGRGEMMQAIGSVMSQAAGGMGGGVPTPGVDPWRGMRAVGPRPTSPFSFLAG